MMLPSLPFSAIFFSFLSLKLALAIPAPLANDDLFPTNESAPQTTVSSPNLLGASLLCDGQRWGRGLRKDSCDQLSDFFDGLGPDLEFGVNDNHVPVRWLSCKS